MDVLRKYLRRFKMNNQTLKEEKGSVLIVVLLLILVVLDYGSHVSDANH